MELTNLEMLILGYDVHTAAALFKSSSVSSANVSGQNHPESKVELMISGDGRNDNMIIN